MSQRMCKARLRSLPSADLGLRLSQEYSLDGYQDTAGIRPGGSKSKFKRAAAGISVLVLTVGLACGNGDGATALPGPTATFIPVPTSPLPQFISPTATRIPAPTATRVVSPTVRFVTNTTPTRAVPPTRAPILTPTIFAEPTRTPIPRPTRTPLPTPTRTPFVPRTQVSSSSPTATPFSPTNTPLARPTATPILPTTQESSTTSTSGTLSFEQSEVYLDITVSPGTTVTATLSGAGVTSSTVQTEVAGSSGQVRLTWTVDQSGQYTVSGTAGAAPISGSVQVQ